MSRTDVFSKKPLYHRYYSFVFVTLMVGRAPWEYPHFICFLYLLPWVFHIGILPSFRQTTYDILANNNNPIVTLKEAISDLESGKVNLQLLKRSNRLSKNPEEYENENDCKHKIGLAIGARKGDVIEYYESDNKEGYSLSPQEISVRKYKTMIWKAVKEILDIAGYDIATIEHELVLNDMDMATKQSLHAAWSGYANLQQGGDSV